MSRIVWHAPEFCSVQFSEIVCDQCGCKADVLAVDTIDPAEAQVSFLINCDKCGARIVKPPEKAALNKFALG